jgi:hypothetical protein
MSSVSVVCHQMAIDVHMLTNGLGYTTRLPDFIRSMADMYSRFLARCLISIPADHTSAKLELKINVTSTHCGPGLSTNGLAIPPVPLQ